MEEKVVEQEGISLADIWAIIKKYWVGLVCITAGCMLLGVLGAFFVLPKSYTATQSVVYLETSSDSQVTEGEISTSRTIVQIAAEFMADKPVYVETCDKLKTNYNIEIDYKDLSAEISNKFLKVYINTKYFYPSESAHPVLSGTGYGFKCNPVDIL